MQVRRLVAVGSSALLAGATLVGAGVAVKVTSVGEITKKLGTVDAGFPLIVVGKNAAAEDVNGAIDIAVRLAANYKEVRTVETGGAKEVTVTKGVSLDQPDKKLYLGNKINAIRDVITKKELPELLKDGEIEDSEGDEYKYTQRIEIGGTATVTFDQPDTDKDPVAFIDISGTDKDHPLYTIRIDFEKAVKMYGNKEKFIGATLEILGTKFTIADIEDKKTLVLYKSAQQISINKGEEKEVTIDGVTYKIKAIGFNPDTHEVVLNVNGETDHIAEGQSKKIGGLEIYAKSVMGWAQGNEGVATLLVGSEKVILRNDDYVRVGKDEEKVKGTYVYFNGDSDTALEDGLSSIEIRVYKTDDDKDKIKAGEEFVDPFTGKIKLAFYGITPAVKDESRDAIKFRVSGDLKGYVTFKDKDGNEVQLYFVKGSDSSDDSFTLADDDGNVIHVVEGEAAGEDEIVFVTPVDASGTPDYRYTRLLRVEDIEKDSTKGYVEFRDVLTGETFKTEEGKFDAKGDTLDVIIDGKTYTVKLVDATNNKIAIYQDDNYIVVYPTLEINNGEKIAIIAPVSNVESYDATSGSETVKVPEADYGLTIKDFALADGDTDGVYEVTISTLKIGGTDVTKPSIAIIEEERDDDKTGAFGVTVEDGKSGSGKSEVSYKLLIDSNVYFKKDVGTSSDDVSVTVTKYGTYIEKDTSDDDHTVITVYYPDTQVYAKAAIGAEVKFSETGGGAATTEVVLPVTGTKTKTDEEVTDADKTSRDIIVVGGPCVNRLAAELLGIDASVVGKHPECDNAFKEKVGEGVAIVAVYPDKYAKNKTAVLVAGWTRAETKKACELLRAGALDSYTDKTAVYVKADGTVLTERPTPATNTTTE